MFPNKEDTGGLRVPVVSFTGRDPSAGEKFIPSGRGGHKNSGNAATFPEFLGGRTNFCPALPAPVRQRGDAKHR